MKNKELIEYLKKVQQPNGSFLGYISAYDNDFFDDGRESLLITAQVLDILNRVKGDNDIDILKSKAAAYIISQKNEQDIFKMFVAKAEDTVVFECDLNTTFLAWTALCAYNPALVGGKEIVALLKVLTDCEVQEGGPYYSFLSQSSNSAIDIGVNINIARFLKLQNVVLDNLNKYIKESFEVKELTSIFYSEKEALLYNLDLLYGDTNGVDIDKQVLADWHNDLIKKHGTITPFFKYISPKYSEAVYIGSNAITVALRLELECLADSPNVAIEVDKNLEKKIYDAIIYQVKDNIFEAGTDLRRPLEIIFDKIIKFDQDRQIGLLSYFFKQAIGEKGNDISDQVIIDLGVANFFVWIAYTIYDDFLDDEGKPLFLSAANFCLRRYVSIFAELSYDKRDFAKYFNSVMDRLDSANAWEVTHCRAVVCDNVFQIPANIPDYKDFDRLAERSLAHALGPIYLLHVLNQPSLSTDVDNLYHFFKHYLIARQLNDDAHDWGEDMQRGHINGVVSELLREISSEEAQKAYEFTNTIDVEKDMPVLQKDFWFKMIPRVTGMVLENVDKSKAYLRAVTLVQKAEAVEKILFTTEKSAAKVISDHVKVEEFLVNYNA